MARPVRPTRGQSVEQMSGTDYESGVGFEVESEDEPVVSAGQAVGKKKNLIQIILISVFGSIAVVLLGVCVYFLATGRISSTVTTLETQVDTLNSTIEAMERRHADEVEALEQAIADSTVHEVVPTTSLQRVEATQTPYLWLIDGDFIAPNPLGLPGTQTSVNSSYVQVGSRFVFRPTESWYLRSSGAIYEFWNANNIWGKIEALSYSGDNVTEESLKNQLQSFYLGYPATEITYRRIYLDDRIVGMFATAEVPVYEPSEGDQGTFDESLDSSDGIPSGVLERAEKCRYILNIGLIQRGEYALSSMFVYEANERASISAELISSLFASCSFGSAGSHLRLE